MGDSRSFKRCWPRSRRARSGGVSECSEISVRNRISAADILELMVGEVIYDRFQVREALGDVIILRLSRVGRLGARR